MSGWDELSAGVFVFGDRDGAYMGCLFVCCWQLCLFCSVNFGESNLTLYQLVRKDVMAHRTL
jgi:hypothetical protein